MCGDVGNSRGKLAYGSLLITPSSSAHVRMHSQAHSASHIHFHASPSRASPEHYRELRRPRPGRQARTGGAPGRRAASDGGFRLARFTTLSKADPAQAVGDTLTPVAFRVVVRTRLRRVSASCGAAGAFADGHGAGLPKNWRCTSRRGRSTRTN